MTATWCSGGVRIALAFLLFSAVPVFAQATPAETGPGAADTDRDGLSDALEQQLLQQFVPVFMVSAGDCSALPARFRPSLVVPTVAADDGTIYGQAFPSRDAASGRAAVELHFYHLWRRDCGGHGHPLDTEHVSALVQNTASNGAPVWKAVYWYAAAHENTVCDVSQITRAATLHAQDHGATVWVSPGKHASFLDAALCERGCGSDRCEHMTALRSSTPVNLGEIGHPMDAALFTASAAWPLQAKMTRSDFPAAPVTRLLALPATEIAWWNAGRHPAQGIIAHSSATEAALSHSEQNTADALSTAGSSTGDALGAATGDTGSALSTAGSSTGAALGKSYTHTRHALGNSARHVGKALGLGAKD